MCRGPQLLADEAAKAAEDDRILGAKRRKNGLGRWRSAYPATVGTKESFWEAAWIFSHLSENEAREVLQETHYEFPVEVLPVLLRVWYDSHGNSPPDPSGSA